MAQPTQQEHSEEWRALRRRAPETDSQVLEEEEPLKEKEATEKEKPLKEKEEPLKKRNNQKSISM